MIERLRNRTLAISVVAALQLAALGFMVWEREQRVRHGTDVVLQVIPVDPRSLFQGDYVILGYDISSVKLYYETELKPGQDIYVTVMPGADGNWVYASHTFYNPQADASPGGIVIKGRVDRVNKGASGNDPGDVRVVYGLERFFVPEGKGLSLEALVRDKKLSAIVSVWRDGTSTLKGLSSEGRLLYETGVAAKRPEDVPPLSQVSSPEVAAPVEAVPATPEQAVTPVPEAAAPAVP